MSCWSLGVLGYVRFAPGDRGEAVAVMAQYSNAPTLQHSAHKDPRTRTKRVVRGDPRPYLTPEFEVWERPRTSIV